MKTGTPPRLHRDTLNYDVLGVQHGDSDPVPFSFLTDRIDREQMPCWITHTNPSVHDLIRRNVDRAPLFNGQIQSIGPRYCPSIEDKVMRFADKNRHQLFLEPEGVNSELIYVNGLSTSLPKDVQEEMVHSIAGLENARIMQWGYAVEYDYVPTDQIHFSLETREVEGLFLAGQINGTSGYEEAAGQGLIAGINAVRRIRGQEPIVLRRDQAYIGVMIDDLIMRPPDEPYRMFTSRAEYRLLLRADNADLRLTPLGREIGLVDDARWERYQRKAAGIDRLETLLKSVRFEGEPLWDHLRKQDVTLGELLEKSRDTIGRSQAGDFDCEVLDRDVVHQIETKARYSGYVQRMEREIERLHRLEDYRIPEGFEYGGVRELRMEARQKLAKVLPQTLGQASRISGITPADITVVWITLEARRRSGAGIE